MGLRGQPYILTKQAIVSVLSRFLDGSLNSTEVEEWADMIECRDDIEPEEYYKDKIENIIYRLANPALEGEITRPEVETLLKTL